MKAIARKTKPYSAFALPLEWRMSGEIYEAESGRFRATVEIDPTWVSIRWTTECGFRWRVFVEGKQAATDCGGTVEYCQQQAEKFIADWPKYPANAQVALLASEQPEVDALNKAIARIEGMAR